MNRPFFRRLSVFFLGVLMALGTAMTQTALADEFDQPIAFSHKTHAGTNAIPCEFCHIYARRSINSGIPPMRTCFGCHVVIKGSDDTQKQQIQKVIDHWEQKKVIPWKKIHDLPDFVHFSHKRHIKAGFDCAECHGEIEKLDKITMNTMKTDLSMGWCVKCHITKHPTIKGQVMGPVRATRGGPVVKPANGKPQGKLQGSKDCYICHK